MSTVERVISWTLGFVVLWIILEMAARRIIHALRAKFQWLITAKEDVVPQFPLEVIEKLFLKSFDPELGWTRKPNEVGKEVVKTHGQSAGNYPNAGYRINELGARTNPGADLRGSL